MTTQKQSFCKGMYVRVPLDVEEAEGEYRDYRLGQVVRCDEVANTVVVMLEIHSPGQSVRREEVVCDVGVVQRCHILSETPFVHAPSGLEGLVLLPCDEGPLPGMIWVEGELCDYYVLFEGRTRRLCEADMLVASHCQKPNPKEQLSRYELHNPIWKFCRDQLIESYAELDAATFGIEDLVGSRIRLLAHQAEVVSTVLSDEACRYVLADEVGLGKTIEASVILKGLLRRHAGLKTLIVVPASLTQQWFNELNGKFWLRFALWSDFTGRQPPPESSKDLGPGVIVSSEALLEDQVLWLWLMMQEWGLLIVDEAHHVHKKPRLYERLLELSREAARVLILSATPIQRRAEEFLALLKLMNPARYDSITLQQFRLILQAQQMIRSTVADLAIDLNEEDFDREVFEEDIEEVVEALEHDRLLAELVAQVAEQAESRDRGLRAAQDAIAYISENYRLESRVIRNRRATLQIELPTRAVETAYSYEPETLETEVIDTLHDYVDEIEQAGSHPTAVEYGRVLLHAAFSSPHVLYELLEERSQSLSTPVRSQSASTGSSLLSPAAPRQEAERIGQLIQSVPPFADESELLSNLLWLTEQWREQTKAALDRLPVSGIRESQPHRLVQVLRAIQEHLRRKREGKIVLFSAWPQTLEVLRHYLEKRYGTGAYAQFHCQVASEALQAEVDSFQAEKQCHILLCDELGGEGRNFQIADLIIHLDLPWTPAQIEQRIGRVDRLGRTGTVLSVVPYARESLEDDLFRLWQEAFHLFTNSMSGMEIALEGILDELQEALQNSSRDGVRELLPVMRNNSEDIREAVEEERYYEENAINRRRREEFEGMSDKYRDGSRLGRSFRRWASLAGLENSYNPKTDTVRFDPKRFNLRSMQNAKFFTPPNMQEALIRSGRIRNLVITGTFNRDVAVRREDLAFFAPGEPWTDAIVRNALEADRGRGCAIMRRSDKIKQSWQGFEFFYRLRVNPRPLYEAGFAPIHLLRAQGFLYVPTYRILISTEGEVIERSHATPLYDVVKSSYNKHLDVHLGKRGGVSRQIGAFKEAYPPDIWQAMLEQVFAVAEQKIEKEFDFMSEVANEAAEEFERTALGLRAASYWLQRQNVLWRRHQDTETPADMSKVNQYEAISAALTSGIGRPLWQLESVCFWDIRARG